LSAAPPAAFGFLTPRPAAISVNGSTLGPVPGTLGLVGGPVTITGGTLREEGSTIHISSAAGTGEVPVDPRNTPALTVTSFGPVAINGGSTLDVSNFLVPGNGGSVFIRTGALTIDASTITSATINASGGNAGSIIVTAGALSIVNGGQMTSATFGPGNAGSVTVTAGSLSIANNGGITSSTSGSGHGGSVSVNVAGQLTIDGKSTNPGLLTGISANVEPGTSGRAGNVIVSAGELSIINNGQITSSTYGSGGGGSVSVNVAGQLTIDGTSGNSDFPTGISAQAAPGSTGNTGTVKVAAGALSIINNGAITSSTFGFGNGGSVSVAAGTLSIASFGEISSATLFGTGNAGSVSVAAGTLSIDSLGEISSATLGPGNAGSVSVAAGTLSIARLGEISSATLGPGNAGSVSVAAGTLSIASLGDITSGTLGRGNAGSVTVNVAGGLSIDGASGNPSSFPTGITSGAFVGSTGNAGNVSVTAGALKILNNGAVSGATFGPGNGGNVSVAVAGPLTIAGTGGSAGFSTGITSDAREGSSGNAGTVAISSGTLALSNGGVISSNAFGSSNGVQASAGNAGNVTVNVRDLLTINGSGSPQSTGIASNVFSGTIGHGGEVTVNAANLSVLTNGEIASATFGAGNGGRVLVNVAGQLTIDGRSQNPLSPSATGITSEAFFGSTGSAGDVSITAGALSVVNNGALAAGTFGPGDAGSVAATAGSVSLSAGGAIQSFTSGSGTGGTVTVSALGDILINGSGAFGLPSSISSAALPGSTGRGGAVTLSGRNITISGGAFISSGTFGAGDGGTVQLTALGDVLINGTGAALLPSGISSAANSGSTGRAGAVTLSGRNITISGGASINSVTFGAGDGGTVQLTALDDVLINGSGSVLLNGIFSNTTSGSTGRAGAVTLSGRNITISGGASISSATAGAGDGGTVQLTALGDVLINGSGAALLPTISSAALPGSTGRAGAVTLSGRNITISGGAQISSGTEGAGNGGTVQVTALGDVLINGSGLAPPGGIFAGPPGGISSEAFSTGRAGAVTLTGQNITVRSGGLISSATAGAGDGGTVQVTALGSLSLTDPGSGIIASAASTASGNAGSVTVSAPQITLTSGGAIASTTAGTGAGGSVNVTTPGALVLNGEGVANTQISASATGPNSGPAGSVTVAANTLTVGGGAQIASATAGPGKGGDVDVVVAGGIILPDRGPQISAQSTGSGDAGSITLSAARLLMSNGGAISTEATASAANGGNITLNVRDFLYLVSSEITASVKGETGNGGNILIDPQLVILNHSSIIASAVEGHGGNITINADQLIVSSDSVTSATGQILFVGPRVDVNGALVVLSSELRGQTEVLREACAARGGQPISSFVEAGRGGLPQDPEATLPALYIAGRDLKRDPRASVDSAELISAPIHTTARLTMRCS
jgi:large exoprotein involved in heme utilization and adhesion